MFDAIRNIINKEKCNICGQVKAGGITSINNKYTCMDCLANNQRIEPATIVNSVFEEKKKQEIEIPDYENKALEFFSNIYGLDPIKENIYLTLEANKAMSILLLGPPASCKTLFMTTIRKKCQDVLYFDGANGSGAGLIEALHTAKNLKILIIDEIDKLRKNELNVLLGLLSNGTIDKILKNRRFSFEIPNLKVFATSNSNAKLSKPLRSRFITYNLPEYTDDEFKEIAKFCLKDELPAYTSELIATVLLENEINDIRAVINVSGWVKAKHREQDIRRIINNNWLPYYTQEEIDYN